MIIFNREIIFNGVFWLLYFLYEWLGLASLYGDYDRYFINACMAFPVSLIFSVLSVHFLFKQLFITGKKLQFWLFLILCSTSLLLIRRYLNYYIVYPKYFPEALHMGFYSFGKILVEFVNLYAISGLYALYYFIRFWYSERYKVQALLQQKTLAELDLLKSQVHPHFIFNTLNNLYASCVKTSPETANLILHLAGFLDYNLYKATHDYVPLTSEISYITHYIELQKNRYGSKLDASINIFNEISDIQIAPLLVLPLIDNCFKHGIGNSSGPGWVRIDISRNADEFSIKIANSIEVADIRSGAVVGSGIGLANVRKRLQLIYPGTHDMKIIAENHSYLVVMKFKI